MTQDHRGESTPAGMFKQAIRAPATRPRAWAQLLGGLFAYGVAIPLMIRSGLGLGPWDAFHVGLSRLTGITVGVASIVVGLAIVLGSLRLGMHPGQGTIANMVLIGVFVDLILPWVPDAPGTVVAYLYYATGIALAGLATGMYIGAGLGSGPRDSLILGISRSRNWSVRRVRTMIEFGALAGGWLMGAPIGIGTVLFAVLSGPATQAGLELFGALPHRTQPPEELQHQAA